MMNTSSYIIQLYGTASRSECVMLTHATVQQQLFTADHIVAID